MIQRVLVAGAGLGGLRAAEGLRANGYEGEILAVGDEIRGPYNRPPLSKQALAGLLEPEMLAFRQHANVADVRWMLGTSVLSVDLSSRLVELSSGDEVSWDALVVATGVSARRLRLTGGEQALGARVVVRTIEDVRRLRPRLRPAARVLVLGAGFIGCEIAATATRLGCEVTCAALDAYPMFRPLGAELGAELRRRHEQQGVKFHLGLGVTGLVETPGAIIATLSDGTEVHADVLVEAVGSVANIGLLDGNGLDLSDGVLVDGGLRPVADDIAPLRPGGMAHRALEHSCRHGAQGRLRPRWTSIRQWLLRRSCGSVDLPSFLLVRSIRHEDQFRRYAFTG